MTNQPKQLRARDLYPGMKLGKLTLIMRVRSAKGKKGKGTQWRIECECGRRRTVRQHYLLRPQPLRECGECKPKTNKTLFNQEYRIWTMMRQRCYSPNHVAYKHYGGRGIKICDEWLDDETGFDTFLAHIGPRPSKGHSVDRIDNDGNYEPGNVRWATAAQQAANKRV